MYYNLTFSMITNMNAARSEFQNRMDAIKQVSNTQLYLIILLAQKAGTSSVKYLAPFCFHSIWCFERLARTLKIGS